MRPAQPVPYSRTVILSEGASLSRSACPERSRGPPDRSVTNLHQGIPTRILTVGMRIAEC
jgi:hypothetical protein